MLESKLPLPKRWKNTESSVNRLAFGGMGSRYTNSGADFSNSDKESSGN
jgi:hypothetical protein